MPENKDARFTGNSKGFSERNKSQREILSPLVWYFSSRTREAPFRVKKKNISLPI